MASNNPSGHHSGDASALGDLLKTGREAAGLTLTELADRLAVSRPYLSRLERGRYAHPSPMVLLQIAKFLDINMDDLYAITGYIFPKDLPSFGPYVRAKHSHWPEVVIRELEDFYDFLKHKHALE